MGDRLSRGPPLLVRGRPSTLTPRGPRRAFLACGSSARHGPPGRPLGRGGTEGPGRPGSPPGDGAQVPLPRNPSGSLVEEIRRLSSEQKSLYDRRQAPQQEVERIYDDHGSLGKKLMELRTAREKARRHLDAAVVALRELRLTIPTERVRPDQLKREIADLEHKQQTSALPLEEENALVDRIRERTRELKTAESRTAVVAKHEAERKEAETRIPACPGRGRPPRGRVRPGEGRPRRDDGLDPDQARIGGQLGRRDAGEGQGAGGADGEGRRVEPGDGHPRPGGPRSTARAGRAARKPNERCEPTRARAVGRTTRSCPTWPTPNCRNC